MFGDGSHGVGPVPEILGVSLKQVTFKPVRFVPFLEVEKETIPPSSPTGRVGAENSQANWGCRNGDRFRPMLGSRLLPRGR